MAENINKKESFAGHPPGLSTLFFTEMWERFSYYGIRPLLVLFMTAALAQGGFGFERDEAAAIVGIYAASVYLASLPGGWIADRLLGLQRAILYGAICIALGHISIALTSFLGSKIFFFLGLVLIVLGTGLLKPNISAIVGELYPEGGARRDAGFSIFYMGINLGAFLGQLVTGYLGENIGWHWGFGAAGLGMIVGVITFIIRSPKTLGNIGKDIVKDPDPQKQASKERQTVLLTCLGIAAVALVFILAALDVIRINAQVVGGYMTYILIGIAVVYFLYIFLFGGLTRQEAKRVVVIAVLFLAASVFWAAFEQAPTALNLFARDFTDRNIGSFLMPATWFQSVNSLFIIIFAPIFAGMWMRLDKKGINISSPVKFAAGLAFAGLGFFLMLLAANIVVAGGVGTLVSPWWLVFSYLFQTFGELLLSPVGLSSMTQLSPKRFVGQMMGVWFLATSLGNLIAGLVGGHVDPEKLDQMPKLFSATTISLFIAAVVLFLLSIPISRMLREKQDTEPEAETA
ncbi:MAG TPA: peptide MFS transporter [Pyrinomonadaceae bacterium]|nr:peptide MFS transporter [Pyrinomonadaceae bacterium]